MGRARRRTGQDVAQQDAAWRGARLGSGPRLVLFHGGPGLEHRILLPLAEQLAEAFEVWVPDLPGHGPTSRADPSHAALLKAVVRLTALEGGADWVIGHSLGAWLLREALRQERISPRQGVILLAPPTGGQPRVRGQRIRRQTRGSLVADLLAQVRSETGRPASPRFSECLHSAELRGVEAYPRLVDAVSRAMSRPLTRLRPSLPVTVISGTCDRVVSPHHAREVALATGAELMSLRGVGHYPAATDNDGVADAIASLVAG